MWLFDPAPLSPRTHPQAKSTRDVCFALGGDGLTWEHVAEQKRSLRFLEAEDAPAAAALRAANGVRFMRLKEADGPQNALISSFVEPPEPRITAEDVAFEERLVGVVERSKAVLAAAASDLVRAHATSAVSAASARAPARSPSACALCHAASPDDIRPRPRPRAQAKREFNASALIDQAFLECALAFSGAPPPSPSYPPQPDPARPPPASEFCLPHLRRSSRLIPDVYGTMLQCLRTIRQFGQALPYLEVALILQQADAVFQGNLCQAVRFRIAWVRGSRPADPPGGSRAAGAGSWPS